MSPADRALAHVRARARGRPLPAGLRVTVHFHPDRRVRDGTDRSTLRRLLDDGTYLSQFATGTSNGGLTAHPGGDRWNWESRLFGAAYDDAPAGERPVYGSLDHRHRAAGGSVRFGSAHLRLRPQVLARTTFCFPDSADHPVDLGVAERCDLTALADAGGRDVLDDYVEAHVHGGVVLARDVEALVLDPCHRGSPVEELARRFPAPVEWHHGFVLSRGDFARPDVAAFRGAATARVGASLGPLVDAAVIGAATWTGELDEQVLKRVWHCVARFGVRSG
ncbi:DUF3626 domain-containing protein [Kineococcus sp. SYSU DK003]|uniref:DUF3626 domain-containing protein n=1 Tax=Kineococcus sp. SYSU DK003 TaxID=3383124 RepID=UPI003D7C5657